MGFVATIERARARCFNGNQRDDPHAADNGAHAVRARCKPQTKEAASARPHRIDRHGSPPSFSRNSRLTPIMQGRSTSIYYSWCVEREKGTVSAAAGSQPTLRVEDLSVSDTLVLGAIQHTRFPNWRFVLGLDAASGAVHHFEIICLENGASQHWRLSPDEAPVGTLQHPDRQVHTGEGLTARALHSIPLGELQASLREAAHNTLQTVAASVDAAADLDVTLSAEAERLRRVTRHVFHQTRRPGRAGRSDIHYARVADLYVRALGKPKPVVELSRELYVSQSQVRNMLHAARQRGLLTAAPLGRPGGQLTEKARQLLSSDSDD